MADQARGYQDRVSELKKQKFTLSAFGGDKSYQQFVDKWICELRRFAAAKGRPNEDGNKAINLLEILSSKIPEFPNEKDCKTKKEKKDYQKWYTEMRDMLTELTQSVGAFLGGELLEPESQNLEASEAPEETGVGGGEGERRSQEGTLAVGDQEVGGDDSMESQNLDASVVPEEIGIGGGEGERRSQEGTLGVGDQEEGGDDSMESQNLVDDIRGQSLDNGVESNTKIVYRSQPPSPQEGISAQFIQEDQETLEEKIQNILTELESVKQVSTHAAERSDKIYKALDGDALREYEGSILRELESVKQLSTHAAERSDKIYKALDGDALREYEGSILRELESVKQVSTHAAERSDEIYKALDGDALREYEGSILRELESVKQVSTHAAERSDKIYKALQGNSLKDYVKRHVLVALEKGKQKQAVHSKTTAEEASQAVTLLGQNISKVEDRLNCELANSKTIEERLDKLENGDDLKETKLKLEDRLRNLESHNVRCLNNLQSRQNRYNWWVSGSLLVLAFIGSQITPWPLMRIVLQCAILFVMHYMSRN